MEDFNNTTYYISLPEVTVPSDNNLLKRLRLAYPDKILRLKILGYLYDKVYDSNDNRSLIDDFYPSDVPVKRLLDIHSKSNYPVISNARSEWVPDFYKKLTNELYDANDGSIWDTDERAFHTPDKKYYRAHYSPLNEIFVDYALPLEDLFNDLIGEYAHSINRYNMPSYFNVDPSLLTWLNKDKYDKTLYDVPGTKEYYAHSEGTTGDYLKDFLDPEKIKNEASSINGRNVLRTANYSEIEDDDMRKTIIDASNELLEGNWNIEELSTKLNITDLLRVLSKNLKDNLPNKDSKEFWNEYHKWLPNNGIGGGGEW